MRSTKQERSRCSATTLAACTLVDTAQSIVDGTLRIEKR